MLLGQFGKLLRNRLEDRQIKVELTQKAKDFLIERGFDEIYGARPIKRTLQKYLEDKISEEIISGKIAKGASVKVNVKDDSLVFEA